jgi:hypothetical protein
MERARTLIAVVTAAVAADVVVGAVQLIGDTAWSRGWLLAEEIKSWTTTTRRRRRRR